MRPGVAARGRAAAVLEEENHRERESREDPRSLYRLSPERARRGKGSSRRAELTSSTVLSLSLSPASFLLTSTP